jgi:hypothetical protein
MKMKQKTMGRTMGERILVFHPWLYCRMNIPRDVIRTAAKQHNGCQLSYDPAVSLSRSCPQAAEMSLPRDSRTGVI